MVGVPLLEPGSGHSAQRSRPVAIAGGKPTMLRMVPGAGYVALVAAAEGILDFEGLFSRSNSLPRNECASMSSDRSWFLDAWRRLRRAVSRNEWAVRLLRLPHAAGPAGPAGAGARPDRRPFAAQLERAMCRPPVPFLRRSCGESATSCGRSTRASLGHAGRAGRAVLRRPRAVPSFRFRDHESGRSCRMFDPGPAAMVQARLAARGRGCWKAAAPIATSSPAGRPSRTSAPRSSAGAGCGGRFARCVSPASCSSTSTVRSA